MENTIKISGLGWVLPEGVGSGWDFPRGSDSPGRLQEFSARPYLRSVKGYLDPAAQYVLAAASLALGEWGPRLATGPESGGDAAGVCAVTVFGAPTSAYRFYEMLAEKGPRRASPMIFPHGYPNTAANLAAIEFGFSGPHMVFSGTAAPAPAWEYCRRRLARGEAEHMLFCAFEADYPPARPDGLRVRDGAVVVWLSRRPETPDLGPAPAGAAGSSETTRAGATGEHGAVAAALEWITAIRGANA